MVSVGECRDVVEIYANMIIQAERESVSSKQEERGRTDLARALSGIDRNTQPQSKIISVELTDGDGNKKDCFSLGEVMSVRVTAMYQQVVEKPCLGISIMSRESISLWSVTTQMMKVDLPSSVDGEERIYMWNIPVMMGAGKYTYALGIGEIDAGSYKRHFRLNFAGEFDVLPPPYPGDGWLVLEPGVEIIKSTHLSEAVRRA